MSGYREHAPPRGTDAQIACLWTADGAGARVLPDACVDVVFSGGRLVVAGPATRQVLVGATPGQDRCGVRFRVGWAGRGLGVPAAALRDEAAVDLRELWGAEGRRLEDRVLAAPGAAAAVQVLAAGLAERLPAAREGDAEVRAVARALGRPAPAAGGEAAVAALARGVGLSERQLLRRMLRAVGYGPATLARVQRFQRFLALAAGAPGTTLARLAADAGYADQAHLARECRRLSGLAPAALLATGAGPAGERSEPFKPAALAPGTLAA
ncbi:AraC family transcriptional regulator [Baekduia soli]|uniref:AraC family transcriptional regulator n=1 Tax=Baekduia soli TaxID=496014 RepID=A0A5B8U2A8_9ACTN|nr:helix-turn-helix domain-containing protein [Baekduia soli]QEC47147.1 AraC family transcriptional regulator [Baekduia soli]